MKRLLILAALVLMLGGEVRADFITVWNFNSQTPDGNTATGTTNPSLGSGTASLFGTTTASFASGTANGGSSDPAASDNSGWNITNFAAQGGSARGVQFNVATTNFTGIKITWDQRHSNTSSRGVEFFYSTDGTNFTSFGSVANATNGDTWFNSRSIDLSSITGVNNNSNFAFRILQRATSGSNYQPSNNSSSYAGGGSGGTWRFDMVKVEGAAVPEPTTGLLLGVGTMACAAFRRNRRVA
jgi:hypothetical protein